MTLSAHRGRSRFRAIVLAASFLASISRLNAQDSGDALAAQLRAEQPANDYSATGTLIIQKKGEPRRELSVVFKTTVTATNWQTFYQARDAVKVWQLTIAHAVNGTETFAVGTGTAPATGEPALLPGQAISGADADVPFAGSDFSVSDLGLAFIHWPQQKVIKQEIKRSRGCTVLESTNPHPAADGCARVDSWIDSETHGIVQAKAYALDGRMLKEFYPKDFKKVNGQWQVGLMEMENDLTDSRSQIKFDLDSTASPEK